MTDKKPNREEMRAQALRANLRRRKTQTRSRNDATLSPGDENISKEGDDAPHMDEKR